MRKSIEIVLKPLWKDSKCVEMMVSHKLEKRLNTVDHVILDFRPCNKYFHVPMIDKNARRQEKTPQQVGSF